MNRRSNLHLHSRFSDGNLWPEAVVARGQALGLEAMALTDHDTMAGLERFIEACDAAGIAGVGGVEIDCVAAEIGYNSEVLAYFPGGASQQLSAFVETRRQAREARARHFLAQAEQIYGVDLPFSLLEQRKLDGASAEGVRLSLNKVDIWELLLQRGVIEAGDGYRAFKQGPVFDHAPGGPRPLVADVVQLIHQDGGVPVLPHPGHMFDDDAANMGPGGAALKQKLAFFRDVGVWGVELYYYGEQTDPINSLVRRFAEDLGLALTAGSDCHGPGTRKDTMERFWAELDLPWW